MRDEIHDFTGKLVKGAFDLSDEMLDAISKEFNVEKLTEAFAQSIVSKAEGEIEGIAKKMYGEFGENLMKRITELGKKYTTRTLEVVKEVAEKTGRYTFPHIPQHFLEIMYTTTQPTLAALYILENNAWNLSFKMYTCTFFNALKEKCGEGVAKLMPCKYACLSASDTLYKGLDMKVESSMDASMAKDGYCQFTAKNIAMTKPMPTSLPERLER